MPGERQRGSPPQPPPEHSSGPGESGPGTPPGMEGTKGVVPLVRRFGPSILINGVAPYFIYFVLHHQFQVAELPALLATSIPPLLDALVGIVRWRRIDFLAGFVLFTIGLAVGLVALGGDPRLYLGYSRDTRKNRPQSQARLAHDPAIRQQR